MKHVPVGVGHPTFSFEAEVRLECVAIGKAVEDDLKAVYFNLTDAALVELYRQQRNMASLKGVCLSKPADETISKTLPGDEKA